MAFFYEIENEIKIKIEIDTEVEDEKFRKGNSESTIPKSHIKKSVTLSAVEVLNPELTH